MSLETWKAEFYPIRAKFIEPGLISIDHSLKKWIGALPENLAKHGCRYEDHIIMDDENNQLAFNANTCSLCVNYKCNTRIRHDGYVYEVCPISQMQGYSCDTPRGDGNTWWDSIDTPEPMIELLEQTNVWYLNQVK